jgi:hypothetical protein
MLNTKKNTSIALSLAFVLGGAAWLLADRHLGLLAGIIGLGAWHLVAGISGPFLANNSPVLVDTLAAIFSGITYLALFMPIWRHFQKTGSIAKQRIYFLVCTVGWLLMLSVGRLEM